MILKYWKSHFSFFHFRTSTLYSAHLEKSSIATRAFYRTVLMRGFHVLVMLLCTRHVKDTQCGFKLFTKKAAKVLFQSLHIERWAFDIEIIYLAEMLKIPMTEVSFCKVFSTLVYYLFHSPHSNSSTETYYYHNVDLI